MRMQPSDVKRPMSPVLNQRAPSNDTHSSAVFSGILK